MYLHALAKLATAEGFELRSLSVWVQRLTAEQFSTAVYNNASRPEGAIWEMWFLRRNNTKWQPCVFEFLQ